MAAFYAAGVTAMHRTLEISLFSAILAARMLFFSSSPEETTS
jgi:hypothetical protein